MASIKPYNPADLAEQIERGFEKDVDKIKRDAKDLEKFENTFALGVVPYIPVPYLTMDWEPDSDVLRAFENRLNQELDSEIQRVLPQYLDSEIESVGAVDTGKLKSSASVRFANGQIIVDYDVDYALFVHEGGYVTPYGNPNASKVFIPGRPWVQAAFARLPMEEIIGKAVKRALGL